MAIQIPLSQGYFAVIDDADAHLAAYKWHAWVSKSGAVYALRNAWNSEGKKRTVALHRDVLDLKPGDKPVDHIDGDGLNCRRSNLRVVTQRVNSRNIAGPNSRTTTGILGVSRNGPGFRAYICAGGAAKHLGTFATVAEANAARLVAERALWGIQPRRAHAFVDAGLA